MNDITWLDAARLWACIITSGAAFVTMIVLTILGHTHEAMYAGIIAAWAFAAGNELHLAKVEKHNEHLGRQVRMLEITNEIRDGRTHRVGPSDDWRDPTGRSTYQKGTRDDA